MQFGTFIPQGWRLDLAGIDTSDHWPTMQRVAWQAENLGFDSIWVYDHFHTVPEPTQEPTYEAWTLMATLAVSTERVRLGQMCTCNGYRSPSYLAKVAASIDAISGGRVEMGIGGGWYEHEYLAYGYPFPKPSVRLGELDEAVQIMNLMWTEDEASFEGKHYSINGAICQPKPVQDGGIPFWIAGGGEQLTLRTAAKYADYTNFGGSVDVFTHKSKVLAAHCDNVGRDFGDITRSVNFNVIIGEDQAAVDANIAGTVTKAGTVLADGQAAIDRMLNGPGMAVGTPDQVIDTLKAFEAEGMSYAIIYLPEAAYNAESMELFAAEVVLAFS
ncbi:MAG: LLM class F420-dependent oxidoreductase [Acidimicrobiia bacterium]